MALTDHPLDMCQCGAYRRDHDDPFYRTVCTRFRTNTSRATAQEVFDRLDAESRRRVLTDEESLRLERMMRVLDGGMGKKARARAMAA